MDSNIQNKNTILNQLEWHLFLKKSGERCLYSATPSAIFHQNIPTERVQEIFDKTEMFMAPETYEDVNQIRQNLALLEEDHIKGQPGSKLAKGVVFELDRLSTIITLLETVLENYSFFRALPQNGFGERMEQFEPFFKRKVLKEFRTFVTSEGEVDYFKHPKLKALYRKQIELEGSIRSILSHLKHSDQYQATLQFAGHDVINDKYVLPVKSDHFSSKLGQIVARSESGRTLYVEPMKIRQANRERFETLLKIDQIIHEIARDFCGRLSSWPDVVDQAAGAAYLFDEYDARSRFAFDLGLSRPELTDDPELNITGFFHPLIERPVKNNMRVPVNSKGVLISGPNTGGKTAAIKSIALCCLFAKQGLFVPAKRAKLKLFKKIFYFGNDQQNLPEGLSSFAAEAKNYAQLLTQLADSNLVIIDEIFNSTSSEEASALAIAFFNEITKKNGTKVIVSTHHQTLKTLAHSREDYISCHVGFDSEKNAPTYKLVYGFPGKSMALEIFREMTLQDETCQLIFKEASKKLDNKMLNYEKLLQDLSGKEEKLNRLIAKNEALQKELRNQKESAKGVAKLKVQEEVKKAKEQLEKIKSQARQALADAKSGKIQSSRKLETKMSEAQAQLEPFVRKEKSFREREAEVQLSKPKQLVPGKKYFCSFVNQTVTLKDVKRNGQAIVSRGTMTIKCPIDSLWESNQNQHEETKVVVSASRENSVKLEYDCRGMRLSEFQNLVENVVPELMSGSVPFINFIHGHGNGTLKDWLRAYIRKNADVDWDQGESGNDGETRLVST